MTDLKIEAGKKYLLRNGWTMSCYAIDDDETEKYPIRGVLRNPSGGDFLDTWAVTGVNDVDLKKGAYDIISEAPKPIEVNFWVRVYPDGEAGGVFCAPFVDEDEFDVRPIAQFKIKRTILPGEGM